MARLGSKWIFHIRSVTTQIRSVCQTNSLRSLAVVVSVSVHCKTSTEERRKVRRQSFLLLQLHFIGYVTTSYVSRTCCENIQSPKKSGASGACADSPYQALFRESQEPGYEAREPYALCESPASRTRRCVSHCS